MLKIIKANYDSDFTSGCETCDYGSEYISNIEIVFEDYGTINIETNNMYEYALTESDFMQLLGNSVDLNDFYKNMFILIKERGFRVDLDHTEIKINGNKIDVDESCKLKKPIKK